MVFADWQFGEVFWAMLVFSLLFLWIWVVIMVFVDVFRSRDLSGMGKALWTLFVIFLPFLGVFSYLIARGDKIGEHQYGDTQRADNATQAYVR
jgi:hypothetical protein